MIRVKNLRPGLVLVPGHRLRLRAGAVAEIDEMSPEIERAIGAGLLVRLDAVPRTEMPAAELPVPSHPTPDPSTPASAAPPPDGPNLPDGPLQDLARLPQAEAVHRISHEHDAKKLRALLAVDRRPRVLDAIRRRLSELEPAGGSR